MMRSYRYVPDTYSVARTKQLPAFEAMNKPRRRCIESTINRIASVVTALLLFFITHPSTSLTISDFFDFLEVTTKSVQDQGIFVYRLSQTHQSRISGGGRCLSAFLMSEKKNAFTRVSVCGGL